MKWNVSLGKESGVEFFFWMEALFDVEYFFNYELGPTWVAPPRVDLFSGGIHFLNEGMLEGVYQPAWWISTPLLFVHPKISQNTCFDRNCQQFFASQKLSLPINHCGSFSSMIRVFLSVLFEENGVSNVQVLSWERDLWRSIHPHPMGETMMKNGGNEKEWHNKLISGRTMVGPSILSSEIKYLNILNILKIFENSNVLNWICLINMLTPARLSIMQINPPK